MLSDEQWAEQRREVIWVHRFALRLRALGAKAERQTLIAMGHALYRIHAPQDAEGIAQAEWDAWPSQVD